MEQTDSSTLLWLAGPLLLAVVLAAGFVFFVIKTYRRVRPGQALVVSRMRDMRVSFTSAVVLPGVNSAQVIDISARTLDVSRRGETAAVTADGVPTDIDAAFLVSVKPTEDSVLRYAQALGPERAESPQALEELVAPKLAEALDALVRERDYASIEADRIAFSDALKLRAAEAFEVLDVQGTAITYLNKREAEASA